MKQFLIFILVSITLNEIDGIKSDAYYKYNVCEFNVLNKQISNTEGLTIIKYSSIDNPNTSRLLLSQYFLVKKSVDTFNVIQIYDKRISDSVYKKYRWSSNWSFEIMKDSCFCFYSQINVKKEINNKYPVVFGRIFAKID